MDPYEQPFGSQEFQGVAGTTKWKWQISGRCWAAMTPKKIPSRMLRGSSQEVGYNPSRSVDFILYLAKVVAHLPYNF